MRALPAGRQPVLDLHDVVVRSGPRQLLAVPRWTVGAGEHWAVLGHNGAGKSTLLSLAGAQRHPTAGTVDVLGSRLGRVDMRALRERIGAVSTTERMPGELTVADVVLTGVGATVQPRPELYRPEHRRRVGELVEQLGLTHVAAQSPAICSAGERARTRLARALVADPALVLLDEPAAGLDIGGRELLLSALDDLAQSHPDVTTVLVTHHLEELPMSTTHALLLADGGVVAAGPAHDVLTSATVSAAYGLPLRVSFDGRWAVRAQVAA
jgi:iron complex transport system ATP-binding protein